MPGPAKRLDPDVEPTPFREAINRMFGERPSAGGTPLDQRHWAQKLTQGGHFILDSVHSWRWEHHMDTGAVADLLSTWNGWTDDTIATAVQAVEGLGGHVTEHYWTITHVCRPPATGTPAT